MAWIWLFVAGVFEITWAIFLKYTDGFSRPIPTIITIVFMLLSFIALAQAQRTLPLGTSYAIWTGMGAIGTAIFGIAYLSEPTHPVRLLALALIVGGIVLLKLFS